MGCLKVATLIVGLPFPFASGYGQTFQMGSGSESGIGAGNHDTRINMALQRPHKRTKNGGPLGGAT